MSLLEKKLAEEAIVLPGSPFWNVFKRFGRDEAIAMMINVLGTAGLDYLLKNDILSTVAGPISRRTKDVLLSATGPIVEKSGFFPMHFKEAWGEYKSTPAKQRDGLATYFKRAVKHGSKSLLQDILVHDPLYVGMMYSGMNMYPETPAWMLSTLSFIGAVFAVAGIEVGLTELAYWKYKRELKKAGFGVESYFESKFFVRADKQPNELLEAVAEKFGLGNMHTMEYHDRYFRNKLPEYSGRIPKLRLRKRGHGLGYDTPMQTAQIVYTRADEMSSEKIEQHRYFPQKKDKIYFVLNQEMPENLENVKDDKARRILLRAKEGDEFCDVKFNRSVAYNLDKLCIATDEVVGERPFYLVELKAYPNKKGLLKEAMRYVMREFPVVVEQTTYGKFELLKMNGD